jgi:hypothetical protein
MKAGLGNYDWAMFDQNGFAYVLKHWQPEQARERVFFETSYTLNGYWQDLPTRRLRTKKPFVKHYMGCQFCSGINEVDLPKCLKEFRADWRIANENMMRVWNGAEQQQ